MRFAVVGAGAMGGSLAAHLAAAGHAVEVLDASPDVVAHIRSDGLRVDTPDGSLVARVAAYTDPAQLRAADAVAVFVKSPATRAAAEAIRAMSQRSAIVVTLQNGWGNADVLAEVIGPERLVMGVTYNSCTSAGPGAVRHSGRGPTYVGGYHGGGPADAAAGEVAAAMTSGGWPAEAVADVRTEIWKKLILNAATLPTAALSRLPAGRIAADPELMALVRGLCAEAGAVARALGLAIDPAERAVTIENVLARAGSGKASMLQDVEHRRKTEIEVINGAVAASAERLGVPVPLNQAMLALVHGLERSWAL
jgi:2-dehydropantoate 2-reductase